MRRIFGTNKPKPPAPQLSDAIAAVDARSETIEKKIAKLDADLFKLREQMSRMREGPSKDMVKQKAMRILKQKRMFETQKEQIDSQSFNMEQSNFAIQGMKDNQVVVAAMKAGLKTMKMEYKKLDLNKIDKMQDEMEEMLDMNSEIQDALSGHYEMPDIDENELEAELDALGDEIALDTDTSYLDEALQAPSIPTSRELSVAATTTIGEQSNAELDYLGLPKVPAF